MRAGLQMSRYDDLFDKIIRRGNVSVRFSDLCYFVEHLGFTGRQKGSSHVIYTMEGVAEIINLQDNKGMAKPYQVRQVIAIVKKYKMGGEDSE